MMSISIFDSRLVSSPHGSDGRTDVPPLSPLPSRRFERSTLRLPPTAPPHTKPNQNQTTHATATATTVRLLVTWDL